MAWVMLSCLSFAFWFKTINVLRVSLSIFVASSGVPDATSLSTHCCPVVVCINQVKFSSFNILPFCFCSSPCNFSLFSQRLFSKKSVLLGRLLL